MILLDTSILSLAYRRKYRSHEDQPREALILQNNGCNCRLIHPTRAEMPFSGIRFVTPSEMFPVAVNQQEFGNRL